MSVFAVSFRHLDIDVLPDCRIEAQTIRGAKDGRGEGRKTRRKEGNGKLGGWIAGEAGREARLALGKWVIRRASERQRDRLQNPAYIKTLSTPERLGNFQFW